MSSPLSRSPPITPPPRERCNSQPPASSAQALLRPARLPFLAKLAGKTMAWGFRLVGKHRYDDFRLERVDSRAFVVTPSVFNPKVPRTGAFLASRLDSQVVGRDAEVLDMGTGSGVCAVFAAAHAGRVVAVDINAAAVRCARINALLNHVEHKVDVRHGDLFAPVAGERFDLVLFNPPFLIGAPRDDRDRAWRSTDIPERFAAGLGHHLKPGGAALLLLSTFGEGHRFLEELRRHGFSLSLEAERTFANEKLVVFKVTPAPPERTP
jgi:HemK-related putative methylase